MKTFASSRGRLAVAAAALVLATSMAQPAAAASRITVDIREFAFRPAVLTVAVGATVTWTNEDEEAHTVTSATGAFASAGLSHEETFTQTFMRPGTYTYFCALHPQMKATVIVK